MRELLIARHGLAHCNVAGIIGGPRSCTGLTDLGRAQAARLASRLRHDTAAGRPVTALHASPRRRARETAEILGAALDQPVCYHDELSEPWFGPAADGQPWSEFRAALSIGTGDYPEKPTADGGESWATYRARTTDILTRLLAEYPGARLLVVGHTETVIAAHQFFLAGPRDWRPRIAFAVDHVSLTTWRAPADGADRWTLVGHNDSAHLAGMGGGS